MNDRFGNEPCLLCGQMATEVSAEGFYVDPCLGILEGVSHACCGHGIKPYCPPQFYNKVGRVVEHASLNPAEQLRYRIHSAYVVFGDHSDQPCYEISDQASLFGKAALLYFHSLGKAQPIA